MCVFANIQCIEKVPRVAPVLSLELPSFPKTSPLKYAILDFWTVHFSTAVRLELCTSRLNDRISDLALTLREVRNFCVCGRCRAESCMRSFLLMAVSVRNVLLLSNEPLTTPAALLSLGATAAKYWKDTRFPTFWGLCTRQIGPFCDRSLVSCSA